MDRRQSDQQSQSELQRELPSTQLPNGIQPILWLPPKKQGQQQMRFWRRRLGLLTSVVAVVAICALMIAACMAPPTVYVVASPTPIGTPGPLVFGTPLGIPPGTPVTTPIASPPAPPPTSQPTVKLPDQHPVSFLCRDPLLPTVTPEPSAGPGTPTATPSPECTKCPLKISDYPVSNDDSYAMLTKAADEYHLPHNLVYSVAKIESGWNPNYMSCSYDIGLMQLKYGYWQSVDLINAPSCGIHQTTYDVYNPQDNAYLGAKLLAWLKCYYSFWGGVGDQTNPGKGTVAWYFNQANLTYPDITLKDGTPNPNSLCALPYKDVNQGQYAGILSKNDDQSWGCPYTGKAGDHTLYDVVVSTYNQGFGTTNASGIQNQWYVDIISGYVKQYAGKYGAG